MGFGNRLELDSSKHWAASGDWHLFPTYWPEVPVDSHCREYEVGEYNCSNRGPKL